jgi:hypothetical protein
MSSPNDPLRPNATQGRVIPGEQRVSFTSEFLALRQQLVELDMQRVLDPMGERVNAELIE